VGGRGDLLYSFYPEQWAEDQHAIFHSAKDEKGTLGNLWFCVAIPYRRMGGEKSAEFESERGGGGLLFLEGTFKRRAGDAGRPRSLEAEMA